MIYSLADTLGQMTLEASLFVCLNLAGEHMQRHVGELSLGLNVMDTKGCRREKSYRKYVPIVARKVYPGRKRN